MIALFFYKKYENRLTRILLLDYWVLFFLTYFIYGISELSNTSWRLCTLLIMAFIVTVDFLFFILRQKYYNKFGYLSFCYIVIALLTIPISVYQLPSDPSLNGYVRMAEVLREKGLTYGYSELWNGADVMNVLTDSTIRISMVSYNEDGSYEPVRYQSQASWYEDQPDVDRYFAVVPNEKLANMKETLVKDSVEQIPFEDVTILVFDRNIF